MTPYFLYVFCVQLCIFMAIKDVYDKQCGTIKHSKSAFLPIIE